MKKRLKYFFIFLVMFLFLFIFVFYKLEGLNLETSGLNNLNNGFLDNSENYKTLNSKMILNQEDYSLGDNLFIKILLKNLDIVTGEDFKNKTITYGFNILWEGELIHTYSEKSGIIFHENETLFETISHNLNNSGKYDLVINLLFLEDSKNIYVLNNSNNLTIYVYETAIKDVKTLTDFYEFGKSNCSDSDGGIRIKEKGICVDADNLEGKEDFCIDKQRLAERYCNFNNKCDIEVVVCETICRAGRCL